MIYMNFEMNWLILADLKCAALKSLRVDLTARVDLLQQILKGVLHFDIRHR